MIQSKKAFTLIELLVVIAIIAIISAVVLANLNTAKSKSRDAKRISDLNQLQLVAQLYFDKCGQYPTSLFIVGSDVLVNTGCPTGINRGTFISQIPNPPSGTSETKYIYIVNAAGSDFVLATTLENTNGVLADSYKGVGGVAGGSGWFGTNGTGGLISGTTITIGANTYAVTSK
ncbi:MAG: prepilin-type N-terminal cleavage/methylation domain-containing protein [Candidatus Taylorbacteria bacterium]|nr:prepilin-type N-terminal cleavage/methylation domain-containing protein [Candidatus Taylorbacteria bacterium]